MPHLQARHDEDDCWTWNQRNGGLDLLPPDLWDACCSQLKPAVTQPSHNDDTLTALHKEPPDDQICYDHKHRRLCCDFFVGSSSYLHLPMLHELVLTVRLATDNKSQNTTFYHVQQDGFLRLYEPSSILWPTGYLLSLCLAAPRKCGITSHVHQAVAHAVANTDAAAVELGAGICRPLSLRAP